MGFFIREHPEAQPNVFPILYEEIFKDDYKKLREMLNFIGTEFSYDLIKNEKFHSVGKVMKLPKSPPKYNEPHVYRAYQVNQPVEDKPGYSRQYLPLVVKQKIENHPKFDLVKKYFNDCI